MENEANGNFLLDPNSIWLEIYGINIIPPHVRNSTYSTASLLYRAQKN